MMDNGMKYYGFYRGIVVQCLNNGFCRIRIPDILECNDGDINTIPIAEAAQTLGGGGDTNSGTFTYPAVDSIVWCFFEGGNIERPVYFATSNAKSAMWDSVSIPTKVNTNKGNDGVSVDPSGHLIKFNKSSIQQSIVLDKQTNEPIGDKIDIEVEATSEQANMYTQHTESSLSPTGFSLPVAASIHLDNKRNQIVMTAKNEIVLHAPKIILDTTGFERPGYMMLKSNEIDNMTDNGYFRILSSKINIDSGVQDIIIQTMGNIWQLKTTGLSTEK